MAICTPQVGYFEGIGSQRGGVPTAFRFAITWVSG